MLSNFDFVRKLQESYVLKQFPPIMTLCQTVSILLNRHWRSYLYCLKVGSSQNLQWKMAKCKLNLQKPCPCPWSIAYWSCIPVNPLQKVSHESHVNFTLCYRAAFQFCVTKLKFFCWSLLQIPCPKK